MIYRQLDDGRIVPAREAQAAEAVRGLGDVVARAAGARGIGPCDACEQRRRLLNQMFPLGGRRQR